MFSKQIVGCVITALLFNNAVVSAGGTGIRGVKNDGRELQKNNNKGKGTTTATTPSTTATTPSGSTGGTTASTTTTGTTGGTTGSTTTGGSGAPLLQGATKIAKNPGSPPNCGNSPALIDTTTNTWYCAGGEMEGDDEDGGGGKGRTFAANPADSTP